MVVVTKASGVKAKGIIVREAGGSLRGGRGGQGGYYRTGPDHSTLQCYNCNQIGRIARNFEYPSNGRRGYLKQRDSSLRSSSTTL